MLSVGWSRVPTGQQTLNGVLAGLWLQVQLCNVFITEMMQNNKGMLLRFQVRRKVRLWGATIASYESADSRVFSIFKTVKPFIQMKPETEIQLSAQAWRSRCVWNGREHQSPSYQISLPCSPPTFLWGSSVTPGESPPYTYEGQSNSKEFNRYTKSTKGRKVHSSSLFSPLEIKK